MNEIRGRARELLPSVLLTLLSMIQALALEIFWTRLRENPQLYAAGWPALLGWLQVVAVLLGIALIWLFYVSLILRFSWVPGVREMLLPFVIGMLEFTLIDLQGLERMGSWLVCLAAIFAVATTESHFIFRAARRDPANRQFFDLFAPATLSDYLHTGIVVALLLGLGSAVGLSGNRGALALVALLFAVAALLHQTYMACFYWRETIGRGGEPTD